MRNTHPTAHLVPVQAPAAPLAPSLTIPGTKVAPVPASVLEALRAGVPFCPFPELHFAPVPADARGFEPADGWAAAIGTPGALDTANGMAQAGEDDESLFPSDSAGQANDTARF